MAPIAISPPSPTLDSTAQLTKVGTQTTLSKTVSNPSPRVADLDASKLTIIPTSHPKAVPARDDPVILSQNYTTDHMLTAKWTEAHGWEAPSIVPYGPLSIMPTASVLHYATECFEGMKFYRGYDGKVRLFRPERNAARLLNSATRIALPGFPPEEFLKMLETFVGLEAPKWLPDGENGERGNFIYLRPTMIGTAPAVGITKPKEALLYVIAVLFPPLAQEPDPFRESKPTSEQTNGVSTSKSSKPAAKGGMRLLASSHDMIRAWPGGFGHAKVGANYGPSIVAHEQAKSRGYTQILWLFGSEGYVTEAGGSNFFVLWKTHDDQGKEIVELVTAPLGDGVILPGVTRASILDYVRATMPEIRVTERRFTMEEIVLAGQEDRLIEAFGAGTAFFVASVSEIHYRGIDVLFPMVSEGKAPNFALHVKKFFMDIQYGAIEHEWAPVVQELTQ